MTHVMTCLVTDNTLPLRDSDFDQSLHKVPYRDSRVHETVSKLAAEFPDFLAVDEFVDGGNFFDQLAVFRTWDTNLNELSALVATVEPKSSDDLKRWLSDFLKW